jgi:hypothetical protein
MEQQYHLLGSFLYWVHFCYRSLGYEFNDWGNGEARQFSEAYVWDNATIWSNSVISAVQIPAQQMSSPWTLTGLALEIVHAQYE